MRFSQNVDFRFTAYIDIVLFGKRYLNKAHILVVSAATISMSYYYVCVTNVIFVFGFRRRSLY